MSTQDEKTSGHFADPLNAAEILDSLSTLETYKDVLDKINQVFPTWIVGCIKGYSSDYEYLTRNWKAVCAKANNVVPKDIVVVKYMIFDDDHAVIMMFAEILTACGYCVRRIEEIGTCETCSRGVPSQNMWELMKEHNLPVPEVWSPKCRCC